MSVAHDITDLNGPAPAFLTEGREPGDADVTFIGKRPRPPTAIDCQRADGECKYSPGHCDQRGKCVDVETPFKADLADLEAELSRNRLNEIATLVRALTYGEMIEFAEAVAKIIASRSVEVASLTADPMASVLHEWSVGR